MDGVTGCNEQTVKKYRELQEGKKLVGKDQESRYRYSINLDGTGEEDVPVQRYGRGCGGLNSPDEAFGPGVRS